MPSVPPLTGLFPVFSTPVPTLRSRPLPTGFSSEIANSMYYNVDRLTDDNLEEIGAVADTLKLDFFHLLDTRVSSEQWSSVKVKLDRALGKPTCYGVTFIFLGG